MKKLLICNASTTPMTNFIRYISHRATEEFEVVAVDNLRDINRDVKNLYINPRRNKFYIGDISDEYFLDRLLHFEKPDFLINYYCNKNPISLSIKEIETLLKANAPLIQISNYSDNLVNEIINNRGTIIEIPNYFGPRQNIVSENPVPFILHNFLNKKNIIVDDEKVSWVYSEDLSSFIWFIIENKFFGKVQMPELGKISELEISDIIKKLFKMEFNLNIKKNNKLIKNYKSIKINGWTEDSSNIKDSLEATIRWYDANRWAV